MTKHIMQIGLALAFVVVASASHARAEYCAEVRYTNNAGGYGFALRNFPNSQYAAASTWLPAEIIFSPDSTISGDEEAYVTARYVRSGWCDEQVDNSCSSNQTLCAGDMKTFEMIFFDQCDFRNYMYSETFVEGVDYTSGFYFSSLCY